MGVKIKRYRSWKWQHKKERKPPINTELHQIWHQCFLKILLTFAHPINKNNKLALAVFVLRHAENIMLNLSALLTCTQSMGVRINESLFVFHIHINCWHFNTFWGSITYNTCTGLLHIDDIIIWKIFVAAGYNKFTFYLSILHAYKNHIYP